jgi:hypothetical protein
MGVNLATIRQYYLLRGKRERRFFTDALIPGIGFLFCLGIWLSLPMLAKTVGGVWLLLGFVYGVIRTRGFRLNTNPLIVSDLQDGHPMEQ